MECEFDAAKPSQEKDRPFYITINSDERKEKFMTNDRVYKMEFSRVYPLLVQKAERKGRTRSEVDDVICWLTGYNESGLQEQIVKNNDYETFLPKLPR